MVVLTAFNQNDCVRRALRAGASGSLLKDAPATRLIKAVRAAALGDAFVVPSITRRLVERLASAVEPLPAQVPERIAVLTDRAQALVLGYETRFVSPELGHLSVISRPSAL